MSASWARATEGARATRPSSWVRSRRSRSGQAAGGGSTDRRRGRARLVHRTADRVRDGAGARPRRSTGRWSRSGPSRRSARGMQRKRGGRPRAPGGSGRAPRAGVRGALRRRRASELWPPSSPRPGSSPSGFGAAPAAGWPPDRGRYDFARAGGRGRRGARRMPTGAPGLGAARLRARPRPGGRSRPESIQPIYLRPPDAELWRERERR